MPSFQLFNLSDNWIILNINIIFQSCQAISKNVVLSLFVYFSRVISFPLKQLVRFVFEFYLFAILFGLEKLLIVLQPMK
jgi:hypothetical protein